LTMLFSEIPGQEEIKQRLIRSVLHDRVSHAQLFAGGPGTMKLPMAMAYARFLCCTRRVIPDGDTSRADACGTCPSCVKFSSLAHPDLHFVFPVSTSDSVEKNPTSDQYLKQWRELWKQRKGIFSLNDWYNAIGIGNKQPYIYKEDCLQIIRKLSYKSYESEYKVMIIWMVEKLYHAAAPSLLKILEEPSDKTLFILISEDSRKILSTILSRTQHLVFPGLRRSDMAGWLERQGFPRDRSDRVASLAEGNLHTALEMAGSDGSTDEFFLLLRNWLRYCFKPQASMAELIAHSEKLAGIGREQQKRFFSFALSVIHLSFKGGITGSLPVDNSDEATLVRNLSPFVHKSNITGYETLFNEAAHHIEHNANAKILFLDMSLRLVKLIKQPA